MLKILKQLRKNDWLLIAISLIFIVTQVRLDLKMPDYMSQVILLVQTEGSTMSEILQAGGYMLLCALGSLASAIAVGFLAARVAASLSKTLRKKTYDKTMSFSTEEMGRFSTSSLITRSTNDITQIQTFVTMGLQAIIKAPIMAVWAIMKIAGKSWQWTAVTGVSVAVLMVMLVTIMLFALPRFKKIQKLTDNLNRVTRENLTGIRVVRAYNAESYQQSKFEKANDVLTSTNLFTNKLMAILSPGMRVIMSGLTLAIYWVGMYVINGAAMADKMLLFSDMVVFSNYAMQVIMSFMLLTMTFMIWPRASVSARRINEVLDTESKITDGAVMDSELYEQGEVEFKNVSFKYPDSTDNVLSNISFTAKKGETVAFIGSTGSGKSTLVNLLPRFYDATEGEVLVNGVNVKDYSQSALRNKLGFVPQRAVLFSGTVSSNIAFGDNGRSETTDEQIQTSAEVAQAREFIEGMENGYDAPIARSGTNVSGGQKQRLSIARAICRTPDIYIFDDSFSALDYKTDRKLRSALKKSSNGVTTLIVAQRIGTIMDADKIIVLDEGKIAGMGTHEDLLKNCSVYHEIAKSQLPEEELNYA